MPSNLTVLDIDEFYQYVALGSVTQGGADAFIADEINEDLIAPAIILDKSGRGNHKMQCWDVKRWVVHLPSMPLGAAGADVNINMEFAIEASNERDPADPTAMVSVNSDNHVLKKKYFQRAIDDVDGTKVSQIWDAIKEYDMPMQISGTQSVGQLLTAAHYFFEFDSDSTGAASEVAFGFYARRVELDLEEAWFDQRDLAELLLSAQILG